MAPSPQASMHGARWWRTTRTYSELLRVALSADGYEVATVANGREAMYYLRSHADACIILLDLALPIMDGAQFRRAQLRDRALAWVPLVVMSGWSMPHVTRASSARGVWCASRSTSTS